MNIQSWAALLCHSSLADPSLLKFCPFSQTFFLLSQLLIPMLYFLLGAQLSRHFHEEESCGTVPSNVLDILSFLPFEMSFVIKTTDWKYSGGMYLGGQTNRDSSRTLLFFLLATYTKIQRSPWDEQAAAKCSMSISYPLYYHLPTLKGLDPETVDAKPEADHWVCRAL